jgi:hypothetical protein
MHILEHLGDYFVEIFENVHKMAGELWAEEHCSPVITHSWARMFGARKKKPHLRPTILSRVFSKKNKNKKKVPCFKDITTRK